MTHGPTFYEGFGRCIYCGATDQPLTKEHIVPLALGGQHIIRDASCTDCARATSRFELDVSRGLWGDFRRARGAPTRRPNKPPHQFTAKLPSGETVEVPWGEYPAPAVFYKLPPAGLLAGLPPQVDLTSGWEVIVLGSDSEARAFEAKNGKPVVAKFRHVPQSFGRLLAKVGYCHALTVFGADAFDPVCIPYIMGTEPNVSYVAGGSMTIPPPEPGFGYTLQSQLATRGNGWVVVTNIRLYANTNTPTYHAVAGMVRPSRVAEVLAKVIV